MRKWQGEGGRLWQFGGAAVLNVPGTHLMAVDLPKVPKVYEAHRTNLDAVRRSPLDWSMLCPGPMMASEKGKPTGIYVCLSTNGRCHDLPTLTFCPDWPW
ncbi:MAG TPA: hypothetical protein VF783_02435, partial [Terriglobales bacterium]